MPRKTARASCPTGVRAPGMVTTVGTARRSCGKAGNARNIHANPGFIWGISVERNQM
jgi:hypothetical protein